MKYAIFAMLLCSMMILSGCASMKISDVRDDDNVGKKVTVTGIVETSTKLGSISGYTLKDDSGRIYVSSSKLPEEGRKVTASGIVMKDTLLGYYIKG